MKSLFTPFWNHRAEKEKISWKNLQAKPFNVPVPFCAHRHLSESIATLSIQSHRGTKSSQWESQKNRFAFISFGKIQFLPPCIWDLLFMSYRLCTSVNLSKYKKWLEEEREVYHSTRGVEEWIRFRVWASGSFFIVSLHICLCTQYLSSGSKYQDPSKLDSDI
jgi:hypothetical protein